MAKETSIAVLLYRLKREFDYAATHSLQSELEFDEQKYGESMLLIINNYTLFIYLKK